MESLIQVLAVIGGAMVAGMVIQFAAGFIKAWRDDANQIEKWAERRRVSRARSAMCRE